MLILIAVLCFIILFTLPFLPGILELIRKTDAEPLFISMDYIRSPRYFGKSFRSLVQRADARAAFTEGIQDITLSKGERMELVPSADYPENMEIKCLICALGDLRSSDGVLFDKEVYVVGDANFGRNNIIQAMASEGNVAIADGFRLRRWLDAEGIVTIGANSKLGISISTASALRLGRDCTFRRLFGLPVIIGQAETPVASDGTAPVASRELLPDGLSFVRMKDSFIPPGTILSNDVVFLNDVQIGSGARCAGCVKSYGKLELEENVIVGGSIFSEGDIIIGRNARIYGNVFSQNAISISEGTVIGRPTTVKSIVGKKSILLEPNVIVYGFVTTEGEGRTL